MRRTTVSPASLESNPMAPQIPHIDLVQPFGSGIAHSKSTKPAKKHHARA
jgi:hypothetical protein